MTSRPHKDTEPPAPRLYLVAPADVTAETLGDALGAADIAAVLLRLPRGDARTLINRVKALAPLVQQAGVALLLDGHAEIVARAGADGAHLAGIDAFTDAATSLRPERIAGCGALETRHDAMLAAERGADYVMFGEPDESGARPAFEAVCERVAWWAEVFESPCVGYAAAREEIAPLVQAGADFVAMGEAVFADPRGVAAAVAEAARMLTAEVVP